MAVCVTHRLCDAGTFDDPSFDAPFVITGSYRGTRPFEGVVERDGLKMDFGGGQAHDLESYVRGPSKAQDCSSSGCGNRRRT